MFPSSGSHAELVKDPEGPYSQLIRLQEANNQDEEASTVDPDNVDSSFYNSKAAGRSGSQRFSLKRSISRDSSDRGSNRHSFSVSFGVPGPIIIQEGGEAGAEGKDSDEGNEKTQQKAVPLRRLAYLNRPELPVLLLGAIAALVHGAIFPVFGLLISSAIKIFFEPPHELKKDARFWALMFVSLGVIAQFSLALQQYFFGVAGGKLIQRIRSLSFERVVHQEISWFDEPSNSRFVKHTLQTSFYQSLNFTNYQNLLVPSQWGNWSKVISRRCNRSKSCRGCLGTSGSKYVNGCCRAGDSHGRELAASTNSAGSATFGGSARICSDKVSTRVQCRCKGQCVH